MNGNVGCTPSGEACGVQQSYVDTSYQVPGITLCVREAFSSQWYRL